MIRRGLPAGGAAFAVLVLMTFALGCGRTVRSTMARDYPSDGVHLLYSMHGSLIQKTVWSGGRLETAWEYRRSKEVLDLAGLGPLRWTKVVRRGEGRLGYLDEEGRNIGFADYRDGEYVGGGH